MSLREVNLAKINIGERFRKDLGDIAQLVESIQEKGVLQPITIDSQMNLLAGGRRCEAAKRAGLTKIPALIRRTEDELDAREIELIENTLRKDMTWIERARLVKRITLLHQEKTGMARGSQNATAQTLDKSKGWVARQLQLADALEAVPELAEMKNEDEVFKQIKSATENLAIEAAREEQKAAMLSELGLDPETLEEIPADERKDLIKHDFLRIAESNYKVQDSFEGMREFLELPDGMGRFDLLEIDPPYGIDLENVRREADADDFSRYNEVPWDEYPQFLSQLAHIAYEVCAPDAWCLFWFGPTWHCQVREALLTVGFKLDDIPCIWDKGAGQTNAPNIYLARTYEPFFVCRKGNPQIRKKGRSNIFRYPSVPPAERYHATQRPLALMNEILSTFTYPNKRVLIPFLGSGVTLRACYQQDMFGCGFDLDSGNRDRFLLQVERDISEGLYHAE